MSVDLLPVERAGQGLHAAELELWQAISSAVTPGSGTVITFTAPHAEAGTTSLAACAAAGLARHLQLRIAIVEANLERPFLASACGLDERPGLSEVLLGAVRSPDQLELEPWLDAAVAAVVGLTDWFVDAVAVRVVGGEALSISEAVRRRRSDTDPADVFIQRLLGIRVDHDQVSIGKNFVQGVVDRAGEDAIGLLLAHDEPLPTPNEIGAPGLWLARLTGE